MYEINIFISHSWWYSHHYDKLSEWIFKYTWNSNGIPIVFRDMSVPKDNPINFARNDATLEAAIFSKIARSNVVVIPMGMYANHSKWIGKEILGSKTYGKPILAVDPWGQIRSSSVVRDASSLEVGWNSQSVANGIWKLYNGWH